MKKRGQIALFLVLGVIILFATALFFYGSEKSKEKNVILKEPDLKPIDNYLDSCIKDIIKKSLSNARYDNLEPVRNNITKNVINCTKNMPFTDIEVLQNRVYANVNLTNDETRFIVELNTPIKVKKDNKQTFFSKVLVDYSIFKNLYMIIDISGGSSALRYSVSYRDSVPSDLLTNDDYKTTKIVLRKIYAGNFTMGSPADEPGNCNPSNCGNCADDRHQHQVILSKDFYMGVFEITNEQYNKIVSSNPSIISQKEDKLPVNTLSWDSARGGNWPNGNSSPDTFIGKLKTKTGIDFDLPTEAQWEYACRAGTTTAFNNPPYGKNCVNIGINNCGCDKPDSTIEEVSSKYYVYDPLKEVGLKMANKWGLYDMHGNVGEWTLDWWTTYTPLGGIDPVGASYTDSLYPIHVLRGDPSMGAARTGCSFRSADVHFVDINTYQSLDIAGPGFRIIANVPTIS